MDGTIVLFLNYAHRFQKMHENVSYKKRLVCQQNLHRKNLIYRCSYFNFGEFKKNRQNRPALYPRLKPSYTVTIYIIKLNHN